jgi:O-antigen/teichoic acid export membrane protein
MMRFTAFISFPLMLGLAIVAREFIVITIGEKWLPCVPLLQILCIGGAFVPLQVLIQNFIISRGRSDIHLYLVSLQIVLQVVLTLALSPLGITAMVMAFASLNVAFLAVWYAALRRLQPMKLIDMLRDVAPFLVVAAAVMAAAYFATNTIDSLWLLLVLRIILATMLYVAIMRMLNVVILKECLNFIMKRKET